jgi:DNA-3-methyladenine glycosylase II
LAVRVIETEADIAEGLVHLSAVDPRLSPAIAAAGPLAVRRREAGFSGLANIIVSQQLSAASASAIWRRVEAAMPAISPSDIAAASDDDLRQMGLSAPKIRTLRAAAAACANGLDLDALAAMHPAEARDALITVKGVGPWTADIYLLFCVGHADIFPTGDLALRIAVAALIDCAVPEPPELETIAAAWSPWRGVAACLFWAYYRTLSAKQRSEISARSAKAGWR